MRRIAVIVLALVYAACLGAEFLAPAHYAQQFRETPGAAPSRAFPLGTDELGRDVLSRLLYGSRVSLLLAPSAALLATTLAALAGALTGYVGGFLQAIALRAADLFLSLPTFFLLITVRAMAPLNVPALHSIIITFVLLGCLGWAAPARVLSTSAATLRSQEFVLQARAAGCPRGRVLLLHVLPNLRPILAAQFWIAVPTFILAEANLGLLGLGVSEPVPSWGGMLRSLENFQAVQTNPWMLAPLALMVVVIGCFHLVVPEERTL